MAATTRRRRSPGEGSITFDKTKGKWIGRVLVDGQYRKVVRATKVDAQSALRSLMADAEGGRVTDGNLTIKTAVARYRDRTLAGKDIAPSTREATEWALRHIEQHLGSRRLKSLVVDDVEKALDKLAAGSTNLSRESLSKIRGTLGRVIDDAIRRGDAFRNVARLAVLPHAAARTAERRSLTPDEFRTMLSACEGERLGALFVTMLGTGMRPGEAAGLRWSAVDLKAKTLAIRSARRRSAKGAIEIVEGLKTRQSRRTLGLPGFVVDALTAHLSTQRAERLAAPRWADPDLAFTTTVGSAVAQPSMRMALAAIAEKAGLGPLSPNELRHSAASVMVDAGEPLDHVAQRLGHRDTRMLEQTYRHAVRPSIDHGVAAMERLVRG